MAAVENKPWTHHRRPGEGRAVAGRETPGRRRTEGALPMTDSTTLQGQRLVVVGAGSRTGRAIARAASAAGAALVLAGPDPRKLEWTAGELSGPSEVLPLDLTDE